MRWTFCSNIHVGDVVSSLIECLHYATVLLNFQSLRKRAFYLKNYFKCFYIGLFQIFIALFISSNKYFDFAGEHRRGVSREPPRYRNQYLSADSDYEVNRGSGPGKSGL